MMENHRIPSDLLAGVRVISLAQQYPGPYCTMLLADLGADVILIEQPAGGDPARGPSGMSPFFAALNRNKRSVTLDLKSSGGVDRVWKLLATADVLVEGFRPGVLDRLGLGAELVRERLPGLIYVSISGYGQQGPDRLMPGHDLSYVARTGWFADIEPTTLANYRLPVAAGDLSSAMFAALSIASALVQKKSTGRGARVDVSMADGLVSWLGVKLEPSLNAGGLDRTVGGSGSAGEPAYGIFRCADGRYITLSIAHEDHFWRNLCSVLNLDAERSLTGLARRADSAGLRAKLATRLESRPANEWIEELARADVPCGPVATLADVALDQQFSGRGLFLEGPAEGGGTRKFLANPLIVDGSRPPIRRPAPGLGEHNNEVWSELASHTAQAEQGN